MKNMLLGTALLVCAGFAVALGAQAGAPPAAAPAPGTAEAGKAYWTGTRAWCRNCHGVNGEGGFGPDLAGRGLNADEFRRAVRQPWGIMPAYTEQQLSEQDVAALTAYFASLPKVTTVGSWNTPVPANAPPGQVTMISAGCGQCHGPELANPRVDAGAEGADFAWFEHEVYEHTSESPTGRMGNFSRLRLTEATLQDIWHYASVDLGLRARVRGQISGGTPDGGNTSYTITVSNTGVVGKGLAAESLALSIGVPEGSSVVSASTNGYQGVTHDAQANADAAVWTAPRIAPGEKIVYTLTLAGNPAAPRGQIRWTKPTVDQSAIAAPAGGR